MTHERRYSEEEIAAIFRQAAEAQEAAQRGAPAGGGLTLSELQSIGRDAGLDPTFVVRAAAQLDRAGPPPEPAATFLGLPISVARTVEVPGPLTDAAWDRLVADLRTSFGATGTVRRDGALRQWHNGNLRVLAEPTEAGYHLHLRTLKGSARSRLTAGPLVGLVGLVMLLATTVTSELSSEPLAVAMMALWVVLGFGSVAVTARGLSGWRQVRAEQMDAVAARAVEHATRDVLPPAAPLDDLSGAPEAAALASARGPQQQRA